MGACVRRRGRTPSPLSLRPAYGSGEDWNTIEDVYELESAMKFMYSSEYVREMLRDLMQQYLDEGLVRFGYDVNYP